MQIYIIMEEPIDIYTRTNLNEYGKETVRDFIKNQIKKHSNFEDILKDIPLKKHTIKIGEFTIDRSSRGFYYERLWDLCIKFGVTDLTLPSVTVNSKTYLQTSHIINENANKDSVKFIENCWNGDKLTASGTGYLRQKVRSGNLGGYSDITFINKPHGIDTEEVFFISVKYFENEQDISKYDIGKLCTLIREHEKENRTIKIYIFVNNKDRAIEKFKKQNASSNILIKYINPNGKYEHIYDSTDLQNAYYKLRILLKQYNYFENADDIEDFQSMYLEQLKIPFVPRFHQRLFIRKIRDLVKKGKKNILVGAIPRSGKSYIMAGTIIDCIEQQKDKSKKMTFLLMTPAPNETFPEYQDMFNRYSDFNRLGVTPIYTNDSQFESDLEKARDGDKHSVIVISKQKLGWSDSTLETAVNEDEESLSKEEADLEKIRERISHLFKQGINIDYMFLDEAHFGMSTKKAQDIVNVLNDEAKNTTKIYVTATYNKPLEAYGVDTECKLTWDINDIDTMKKVDENTILNNNIVERFGKSVYEDTLKYFGDESGKILAPRLKKEYSVYPKPYLITSLWDKDFLKLEKALIGDTEFGWDMGKLFATNGTEFINKEQITEIMRYYFGQPNRTTNYNDQAFYRSRGILPRIQKICTNQCRTLQTLHKTTQLWFLPLKGAVGDTIHKRVIALINLFSHTNEFKYILKSYHFYVAVEVKKKIVHPNFTYMKNSHTIKKEIEELEDKIKRGDFKGSDENKPDNLIILAGQRLQLGISLRNVDIVTLWNSTTSDDALFQMLFRSMTEVDNPNTCIKDEYCGDKKFGFMVDMNPQRAIMNVSLFNENMAKTKDPITENKQEYTQIADLINIDDDVFQDKYDGDEKQKDEFVRELFNKLYSAWNTSSDNIRNVVRKLAFDTGILESIKDQLRDIQIQSNKKSNEINAPGDNEKVPSGKKQEANNPKKDELKKDKPVEINLEKNAVEIVSEFITLLNIFTLYLDNGSKCILISSTELDQVRIIGKVRELKKTVFADANQKDIFLKILNGRLYGNDNISFPETIIDKVLESVTITSNIMLLDKVVIDQKTHYYTINDPVKLLEYINDQLKPKEKEKKENGEVFTPLSLVNEMLDKLDEAYIKEHGKSIFTEEGFKWLDPAVGIGNFPVAVYLRLMKGLITQLPNEEERRKHILEQMIYSAELTPKNVFIYKKIFCGDKYKLNIYEGDTLKMDMKNEFNLPADFVGFDVVMGNPPYNAHGTKHKGDKNIYVYFSQKALTTWLKPSGYLVFIHPPVYRIPNHKIQHTKTNLNEIYTTKKILCIKIYSIDETHKLMSVMINVDFIILQNTPNDLTGKSKIIDAEGDDYEIQIKPNDFIPNFGLNIMEKIKNKTSNGNIELKLDSEMHAQKTKGSKYKNIHGIISKGIKICLSDTKHKFLNEPKIIINGIGSYNYIFYDKKGEYGITQSPIGIINPSANTLQFIQSPLFHYIANSTKIIGNNFNIKTSLFLPIIPEDIKIKDVNDLYKYFDFSKDEITNINSFSIPTYKDQELSCDGKTLLNGNPIPNIKPQIVKEDEAEEEEEEEEEESITYEKPPSTERKPLQINSNKLSPTPKPESKKRSSKLSIPSAASKSKRKTKKQKLSSPTKSTIDSPTKQDKIFNEHTKRWVKNTKANRKMLGILGGLSNNKTRKNTIKNKKNI